jgi:hypothetical protein
MSFLDLVGITKNTECFNLQLPFYHRHKQVKLAVYIATGNLLGTFSIFPQNPLKTRQSVEITTKYKVTQPSVTLLPAVLTSFSRKSHGTLVILLKIFKNSSKRGNHHKLPSGTAPFYRLLPALKHPQLNQLIYVEPKTRRARNPKRYTHLLDV